MLPAARGSDLEVMFVSSRVDFLKDLVLGFFVEITGGTIYPSRESFLFVPFEVPAPRSPPLTATGSSLANLSLSPSFFQAGTCCSTTSTPGSIVGIVRVERPKSHGLLTLLGFLHYTVGRKCCWQETLNCLHTNLRSSRVAATSARFLDLQQTQSRFKSENIGQSGYLNKTTVVVCL